MKLIRLLFLVLIVLQAAFAEFTIHILSPWKDDTEPTRRDSLRMVGNSEVNYYPGSSMVSEGAGWFYYDYKTIAINSQSSFKITTWIGKLTDYKDAVTYGRSFRIDSLFLKLPPGTEDIWVVPNPDTMKLPTVYTVPPNAKVINILNPWPENSPKIIIGDDAPVQMRLKENFCGWYQYYYAGIVDSLSNVTFTDYYAKKSILLLV
jgi:hypothetical protein